MCSPQSEHESSEDSVGGYNSVVLEGMNSVFAIVDGPLTMRWPAYFYDGSIYKAPNVKKMAPLCQQWRWPMLPDEA
jgi:hypothetical protein